MTISRLDRPFRAIRRAPFGLLACLWFFLLLVADCSGSETSTSATSQEEEAEATADPPNIVFVLADDLDYASAQKMPEIGSLLVEGGASFEEAFTSQSLCCPSRATMLTGLYAHTSGIQGNKPPDGGFEKFRDDGLEEDTIAARLQEEGYQTAYFGKYLNGYGVDDPSYVPPGWDEWYGKLKEQKLYDYELNENGEVVPYGNATEDFVTDVLSGQATEFVRQAVPDDKPFFAYVAPTAPHEPATPAERHEGAFADEEEAPRPPSFDEEDISDKPSWIQDRDLFDDEEVSETDERYRRRLESMLAVDDMVGALVEELEAAGELENTFIFFTSDNGFLQGEHRWNNTKDRPYEESARVPLFVRGPGIAPGMEVKNLVLNTDFAPTFAELAGVDFSADGRSLVPLLRGEEPSSWRSAVLLEGFIGRGPRVFGAVRTEEYKYVEYGNGEEELYDLRADPYELESLHETADASLIEDLKGRLEALRDCAGAGCLKAEDAS